MGALAFILPGLLLGWGIMELFNDDDDNDEDVSEGVEEDDNLIGTEGNDILQGRDGDDTLDGGDGRDVLVGGRGDDKVDGGAQIDVIAGGAGDDVLNGGADADWIEGDPGKDTLEGGDGNDLLFGGIGADSLDGGAGDDVIISGNANTLPLSLAQMKLLQEGKDLAGFLGTLAPDAFDLSDDGNPDTLNGGDGMDTLVLGAGDTGDGGADIDAFMIFQDQAGNHGPAVVQSFEEDESIGILSDDATYPEVTVKTSGDDALVLANDVVVARVVGAAGRLDISDVFVYNVAGGDFYA